MKNVFRTIAILLISIFTIGLITCGISSCSQEDEILPPGGQQEKPEKVPEYIIEYVADGVTVGRGEYIHAGSELVPPKIPEKAGYIARWEDYDITGEGDIVVNAIYTPIVYTITYEVVKIKNGEIERNYRGTWGEYWRDKIKLEYPTEYTVESDEFKIPYMPSVWINNSEEEFLSWYTDEACTEKIGDKIPKGTTGNITLFAKSHCFWTGFY